MIDYQLTQSKETSINKSSTSQQERKLVWLVLKWGRYFLIAACTLMINPNRVSAVSVGSSIRQGNQFYQEGDYESSIEKYTQALEKDPESAIIHFNLGTALYKKREYAKALEHLHKAILSDDDALKEKAHYNLGSGLYKTGIAKEDEDLAFAIDTLRKALQQYESALSLKKDDDDARFNYEFVKKELERLKEKKDQQQKQSQEDSSKKEGQETQPDQQSDQSQDQQTQQQNSSQQEETAQDDQQQASQQEQTAQEDQKDQEKEGSGQQNEQPAQPQSPKEDISGTGSLDPQELTPQEAEKLVDRYRQTEEPQGLLDFFKNKRSREPVSKDW